MPFKFDAIDPISKAFSDFDLTDIVFSRLMDDRKEEDKNIVLINMSEPPMVDRAELAQILDSINKHSPAVVAIDGFYRKLRPFADTLGETINPADSMLAKSLAETKNLVLVTGLKKYNEKKKQYDSLETSHPLFCKNAKLAFASLTTTGEGNMSEFLTSRSFIPKAKVLGKTEVAFGVKIAELYAPKKAKKFLQRDNVTEFINFQGNIGYKDSEKIYFPTIDFDNVLQGNFTPDMIKGKIVILGFMGKKLGEKSFDDKFYTPLNKNYVGKSTPDMFGVVVHANIVSMILKEAYIDELSDWLNTIIMVLAAFFSISLFSYFFRNFGYWYDAVTVFCQFLISFILLTSTVFIFLWYRLKIDASLAIGAVVLSGLVVEIYYGLVYKVVNKIFVKKRND
jgi:CHASE2 domain-containing sensor protein